MKRVTLLFATLFVVLVACDKENKKADPDPQAATTTNAATAAQPPAIADTDIATAADFEDEAEKAITAKNYKGELASLETEVAKDSRAAQRIGSMGGPARSSARAAPLIWRSRSRPNDSIQFELAAPVRDPSRAAGPCAA